MIELRDEPADGAAARALFEAYVALLRERSGNPEFAPVARIFATERAFNGPGAAWVIVYEDGVPVGCGGLRTLAPGIGEIKRMFVAAPARGRGLGRRLLRTLEARAAATGQERVRLLTTPMLAEACALYAAEGYVEIDRRAVPGEPEEVWLEKVLGRP